VITSRDVRDTFLSYYNSQGHAVVPSSSLVPHGDPSLLFTNAGMVQFKRCFLGEEQRPYTRAASSQKCVRAGGKHNDLENVGYTARHHTFFEMLGNFSFGDYFKEGAIETAWELLTEKYGLPKERLWATVFHEDDEARVLWQKIAGLPQERIVGMGEKDNFWAMGDTGPCGPCSEIIFDQGEAMACGPDCAIGVCECDRYLEIWNLVFMQFNRTADGVMHPLPKPSIDTGMGLERLTAVLQGVQSNFDTDLLRPVIGRVEELAGFAYGPDTMKNVAFRVIADHARATAFLMADGVLPSQRGAGLCAPAHHAPGPALRAAAESQDALFPGGGRQSGGPHGRGLPRTGGGQDPHRPGGYERRGALRRHPGPRLKTPGRRTGDPQGRGRPGARRRRGLPAV
jgi:alanyl-tRNA synthetase